MVAHREYVAAARNSATFAIRRDGAVAATFVLKSGQKNAPGAQLEDQTPS
jgi:hypothetical protein